MGILDYLKEGENPGIIEETALNIIIPIKEFGITGIANETEAISIFSILLGQRAQSAIFADQKQGNLLLDTGIDKFYQLYKGCFGEKILGFLKTDLPLFVFTAMYLESPILRQELKSADEYLKKEVFGSIHTLCNLCFPNLVRFPDILSVDNMKSILDYLENKDHILKDTSPTPKRSASNLNLVYSVPESNTSEIIIYRAECLDIDVIVEIILNECILNSPEVREDNINYELRERPDLAVFLKAKMKNKQFRLAPRFILPLFSSNFSFKEDKYLLLAKMVLIHNLYSNILIAENIISEEEGEKEFIAYLIEVLQHRKFADFPIAKYFTHNYKFNNTIGKRTEVINFVGDLSLFLKARNLITLSEAKDLLDDANNIIEKLELNKEPDYDSESRVPLVNFTNSERHLVCFITMLSLMSISQLSNEVTYLINSFFNDYGIANDIVNAESDALETLGQPPFNNGKIG